MAIAAMDIGQAISSVVLILTAGACILIPMWFRQRLVERQLDAVTKAMEKGIDPEQVLKHIKQRQRGDINGNWKAGLFLTFVGFIIAVPMFLLAASTPKGEGFGAWIFWMIFPLSGVALLMIHKRIVGRIVKYDEMQSLPVKDNGNGDSNTPAS